MAKGAIWARARSAALCLNTGVVKNLFTLNFGDSFKDNQPVWNKNHRKSAGYVKLNVFSILLVYIVLPLPEFIRQLMPIPSADRVTTLIAFVLFCRAVDLEAATMAIVFICGGFSICFAGWAGSLDYSGSWSFWDRFKRSARHLSLPVVLLSYDWLCHGLSRYMR